MTDKLKEKIAQLPQAPGVYIFKDAEGKIIYIGKAKSLKKRVQSYFNRLLSAKTQVMVSKIADFEYRPAASPSQAQLMESALIKEHLPQYNISLKDDKSFPLIRITGEDFPIVSICRRKKALKNDTSLYFGPYTDAGLLRQALKAIRRVFGFRSCKQLPRTMCLYGRINLCPAPCICKVSRSDYRDTIKDIIMFLESKHSQLIDKLSLKMHEAARRRDFEEAARVRDQINALAAVTATAAPLAAIALTQSEDLGKALGLQRTPKRIEAFDISDIFGKEACGSMVSFYKGLPDKNHYRRFRIKTVAGIDDYKMLAEVVARRYSRLLKEKLPLPDLILIDGGKGHLLTAGKELEKLGLQIPLVSIAKDRENIYTKEKAQPLRFASEGPALNLIRRIRDEAHRFALSYHHVLRRKSILGR